MKVTIRSITVEILAVELANRTVWHGQNIHGHSVQGIRFGGRGLLPEPYWTAAEEAVYAVYHYETPIAWEGTGGVWYVPDERYGQTTNVFRGKIVKALEANGYTVESI